MASCQRRLLKDIQLMVKNTDDCYNCDGGDYNVYLHKPLLKKDYVYHLDYIYHLLWVLNRKMPNEVTRDYIFPHLQLPIQWKVIKGMEPKDLTSSFTVQTVIADKEWNMQFNIPKDYPFKPPKIRLNGISSLQLKNLGNNDDVDTFELMKTIDEHFHDQWSPVTTIKACIELLTTAIDVHNNLSYKSTFLEVVDKLASNTLKVS